ncbi:putative amidohydrolase [Hoeflea marina]|uniref:Putative amidohydrolase n=1 Tax=Hoeflea marina TaxID=274592 RepID=A0A317PDU4_9HYPH|nr:carbon-nitrogen hydrolase family protein [Hoeflea marina]PWV98035.1 putative amidohydrolase [Hoeflea marina]
MTELVVAAIQMCSGIDPANNIVVMERLVREAAARGASYVQTPEMTGAIQQDRKALFASLSTEEDDAVVRAASRLAAELGIFLHLGSTGVDAGDGMAANRGFVFDPRGRKIASYDKIHMFDVDLDGGESWRESTAYRPGSLAVNADMDGMLIGMGICYDVRFPQLFRDLSLAGASILTAPAAFTRQTGMAHWHVLQRARAIENGAFMISAAQAGRHEDGRETYGHSLIIDPWGRIVAEAETDEPGVVLAKIDISAVAAARAKIPNLKNARPYRMAEVVTGSVRERVA